MNSPVIREQMRKALELRIKFRGKRVKSVYWKSGWRFAENIRWYNTLPKELDGEWEIVK